jgi:hypothetical protein
VCQVSAAFITTNDKFLISNFRRVVNVYVFSFWVIPRGLNFVCWRFGKHCLFHIHRQVGIFIQNSDTGELPPKKNIQQTINSSANDNDSIGAGHFQVKMEYQVNWRVDNKRTKNYNNHVHSTAIPMGVTGILPCESYLCLIMLPFMVLIFAIFPSSSNFIFLNFDLLVQIRLWNWQQYHAFVLCRLHITKYQPDNFTCNTSISFVYG